MLKKSKEDSIKSISKKRRDIEEAKKLQQIICGRECDGGKREDEMRTTEEIGRRWWPRR
jgi:hypothetical protein